MHNPYQQVQRSSSGRPFYVEPINGNGANGFTGMPPQHPMPGAYQMGPYDPRMSMAGNGGGMPMGYGGIGQPGGMPPDMQQRMPAMMNSTLPPAGGSPAGPYQMGPSAPAQRYDGMQQVAHPGGPGINANERWKGVDFNAIFNQANAVAGRQDAAAAMGAANGAPMYGGPAAGMGGMDPMLSNEPLPFPPSHLLAQFPFDFQQQLIVYYRLLRHNYPELYEQYCKYYETYYEPLYFPEKEAERERLERQREEEELRERELAKERKREEALRKQRKREEREREESERARKAQQQQQERLAREREAEMQRQRDLALRQQQSAQQQAAAAAAAKQAAAAAAAKQAASQPAPAASPSAVNRDNGGELVKKSSTLSRQSSIRRQNSMRRNEVNQQKNDGAMRRLPSMRKA